MPKKYYVLAIVSFLLIPPLCILGARLFDFINPEIAAGHPNYVRNFELLTIARKLVMWAALLGTVGLWFSTCLFVLKSRERSYAWLWLAILGPLGFTVLTMPRDLAPAPGDLYQRYLGRLNPFLRVAQEFCFLVIVWWVTEQAIALKRNLMIAHQAAVTGTPVADIIAQQNASGGMWAFGEALEQFYLVVLCYLLWPVCFNAAGHLLRLPSAVKRD